MPADHPTNPHTQNLDYLPSAPGIYALALRIEPPNTKQIGRLGTFTFSAGNYLYLGSARGPGGIRARVRRHLRNTTEKRRHWHVDWLREIAQPTGVLWSHKSKSSECEWAATLKPFFSQEPSGFGASDCRCEGHLLRLKSPADLHLAITALRGASTNDVHLLLFE